MSLELLKDKQVEPEVFIENGCIVNCFNGQYQQFYTAIDGVSYTTIDTPCLHLIFKDGADFRLACYIDTNDVESYSYSHRKLR